MRASLAIPVLLALAAAALAPAHAQPRGVCRVEPFQGATLPQGTVAQMTVAGGGASCAITNYGVPADKRNPAYSGAITVAPSHGAAVFDAPRAKYTPAPGYVGEDEFAYEAIAKGNVDQEVRLRVRVKVKVAAP